MANREPGWLLRLRQDGEFAVILLDERLATDAVAHSDFDGVIAGRVLPWLERARDAGIEVLIGDPGRRYLPVDRLVELAVYEVRTTTELEDLERKEGRVYRLQPAAP